MNVAAKGVDADLQSAAAQVSSLVSLPSSLSSSLTQQATAGIYYLIWTYTSCLVFPSLALPYLPREISLSSYSPHMHLFFFLHPTGGIHRPLHSLRPSTSLPAPLPSTSSQEEVLEDLVLLSNTEL